MLRQEQGRVIKTLRTGQNLTQEELAYRAGVSIDAIRQLETGVKLARMDTLFKISKGLDVDPSEIYAPLWDYWQSET